MLPSEKAIEIKGETRDAESNNFFEGSRSTGLHKRQSPSKAVTKGSALLLAASTNGSLQTRPGPLTGLVLRTMQFVSVAAGLVLVNSTVNLISWWPLWPSVAMLVWQCLWSISLAVVDVLSLLTGKSQKSLLGEDRRDLITLGDTLNVTLILVVVFQWAHIFLVMDRAGYCAGGFRNSTAMAFVSFLLLLPSVVLDFVTTSG